MPFRNTDGVKFTGATTVYDLLQEAVENLELDLPVCEWLNLESDDSTAPSLKTIYIDRARIYDMQDTEATWRDVLELCFRRADIPGRRDVPPAYRHVVTQPDQAGRVLCG